MAMVATAVAAAVTWVSSAAASAAALVATSISVYGGVSLATSISITNSLASLAASSLGSFALNAVFAPKVNAAGSPIAFKADPSAPIKGIMGRFGTGGTQNHFRVWGKNNLFISYSVILSLGPIQGIESFTANKLPVNFTLAQGQAANVEPYRDKMWMTYKMGLPGDPALGPPVGISDGHVNPMNEWTANHRTSGYAGAFWTMKNNSKRASFEGGVPIPNWVVLGQKLYDPRKDSTQVAIGGNGAHRWDDWRTWEFSKNPKIHALNWALGHHKKLSNGIIDRTKLLAGVGATIDKIDLPTFVAGANISDANNWTIAGEWTTQDDKWQVLAGMLQAGSAVPCHVGAKIGIMVNAPRASVATITNDDIIGKMNLKVMASRRDRFNTVFPRYINEQQGWEYSTAGAVTADAYKAQDGGVERSKELTYNWVDKSLQAGQLAAYDLANTRETLKIAFPAKPHLLGIKPGDAVTVYSVEHGLDNQKFIVVARPIELMEGTIGFELRSETDSKHAWALGQADQPAPSPSLTAFDPAPSPPDIIDWGLYPLPPVIGGAQQPGFVLVGEVPDGIGSVLVEVAPTEVGPWESIYSGPPTTESVPITGLQSGEVYYLGLTYLSVTGYPSDRTVSGPYTAPTLISEDTVNVGGVNSDLFVSRMIDVESLSATNAAAVSALETIYGDTASAAASAAQAALSEANVITLAGQVAGDASAASTSAAGALASEGAAGSSAAAASASASTAATKAGEASSSATNAASSADDAEGHAALASSAATNAAASQLAAGNSATAASGSASTAATKATEAGNSAAAAAASQVSASSAYDAARLTAAATLPFTFEQEGRFWFDGTVGTPETRVPLDAAQGFTFPVVSGVGKVVQYTSTASTNVASIQAYKLVAGRTHRVTAIARTLAGQTIGTLYAYAQTADYLFSSGSAAAPLTLTTDWTTVVVNVAADTQIGLGAVMVRPVLRTTTAGVVVQLQVLKIEDTTESVNAGTSASAAATSASSAASSASAAGSSASAASGSATTAGTHASNASTYATQSSNSASAASGSAGAAASSALAAGTSASTAGTHAATASTQASNASASASSASASATLAASMSVNSLLRNARFSDYPVSPGYPTGWIMHSGSPPARVAGEAGGYAAQLNGGAGQQSAFYQQTAVGVTRQGQYSVLEADIRLDSGTLEGAGVLIYGINAAGVVVESDAADHFIFDTYPDSSGIVVGDGVTGKTYRFSHLVKATHPDTVQWRVYACNHLPIFGSIATANSITWFKCSVRAATEAEVAAGVALPALSAAVDTISDVVADLEDNYTLARYQVAATTPGGAAILSLISDSYGTVAGLTADQVYFGENTFFDNATDTLRTTMGASTRVIAFGASFGTDGQLTEWEGPSSVAYASMSRANAYFYRANVAPYVGGSGLPSGDTAGGGAKALAGSLGSAAASASMSSIAASSLVDMSATFEAPKLTTSGAMYGYIKFEEGTGGTWTTLGQAFVEFTGGLYNGNGTWYGGLASADISEFGVRTGTVTYRATFTRTSGANLVGGSNYIMRGNVKVTPPGS